MQVNDGLSSIHYALRYFNSCIFKGRAFNGSEVLASMRSLNFKHQISLEAIYITMVCPAHVAIVSVLRALGRPH